MTDLSSYKAASGSLKPVWRIEIRTRPDDADRIVDAIMEVYPLPYGRYHRNACVSAVGAETTQGQENSTFTEHVERFAVGETATYPVVELKVSVERDLEILEKVMNVINHVHHYELPVVYIRDEWENHADYDPKNENPHRWWNDGRGLPDEVELSAEV